MSLLDGPFNDRPAQYATDDEWQAADHCRHKFSAEQAVNAFMDAQHADFTRTQVQRMIRQAQEHGSSANYGDGYNIIRTDNFYQVQIAGKWL
jgi:hypothetical protein